MNETINLPRLISLIAEGAGVQPAVARRFLHDFFAQIEAVLTEGESVAIKGVGEFVRSDDPANPILFKADDELAAIANEPFAAFEAVELNDGAAEEIANVPAAAANQPEPEPKASAPASEPEQEAVSEPEQDAEISVESVAEANENSEKETETETETESEAEGDTETMTEPEPEVEPEIEPEVEPEVEPDENKDDKQIEDEPKETTVGEPHVVVEKEIVYVDRPAQGGHGLWFILGILLGIIVGLVGGYFAGKTMAAFEIPEEEDEDYTDSTEMTVSELLSAEIVSPAATVDTAATAAAAPAAAAETETPKAQPEVKPAPAKAEPVYDTVTQRRFLTQIARDHYGVKNYWIFIYAANKGLGNPNRIAPGTRVEIPDKSTFMEATREATDAKASKMIAELEKKYK